eukprot:jgi/Tetstr1/429969/TSEL_019831.t1
MPPAGAPAAAPPRRARRSSRQRGDAEGQGVGGGAGVTPWLWGCLIVSRQGKCLVHCMLVKPPGLRLHTRQLGNMFLALQNLAGAGRTCFVTLNHYSVGLAGRQHFVVALLAPPGCRGNSVELRAEQIAHSFQFYHGAQLAEVSAAEEAEAEKRLSTYTVHDIVSQGGGSQGAPSAKDLVMPPDAGATLPRYLDFEALYLRQTLRAPSYSRMWLATLSAVPGVRHVALVGVREGDSSVPYEMLQDEGLSYRPAASATGARSRGGPALACVGDVVGPVGSLAWATALAGCQHLVAGRRQALQQHRPPLGRLPRAGADALGRQRQLPGYLTLALEGLSPPLMVFIKALSIPVLPHEVCVVVFFQDEAAAEPARPEQAAGSPSAPLAGRVERHLQSDTAGPRIGHVAAQGGAMYGLAYTPRDDATTPRLAAGGTGTGAGVGVGAATMASPRGVALAGLADAAGGVEGKLGPVAAALMKSAVVVPGASEHDSPVIPSIIRHGLKVSGGLIRGAFPFFDDADAARGLGAAPLMPTSAYHSPTPPTKPSPGGHRGRASHAAKPHRRAVASAGAQVEARVRPAVANHLAESTTAEASGRGSSSKPVVPRLALSKIKQQPEGGRRHEPSGSSRQDDEAAWRRQGWQQPGSSVQRRTRTPSWVESKRAAEGDIPISARASTPLSAPRHEAGSGQWYLGSPRVEEGRRESSVHAVAGALSGYLHAPGSSRRAPPAVADSRERRRHSAVGSVTWDPATTPRWRGSPRDGSGSDVGGEDFRFRVSDGDTQSMPLADARLRGPATPRGGSPLRAVAAGHALERQLAHSAALLAATEKRLSLSPRPGEARRTGNAPQQSPPGEARRTGNAPQQSPPPVVGTLSLRERYQLSSRRQQS